MKPLYIFDLDYTISDPTHRSHHLKKDPPDWETFGQACGDDLPVPAVITTLTHLRRSGAEVFIWTGRGAEHQERTITWLYEHRVGYEQLLMRPIGNREPDRILKGLWLDSLPPTQRDRLVAIFDDNDRMVAFWRALGVPCFQVRESAY